MADDNLPQRRPELDPEELRQFREFQRFREFERFRESAGGEVAVREPPEHRRRPRWRRLLAKKWFRRLLYVVIIVGGLIWALSATYDYLFGGDDERPAAQTGGGKYHTNPILSDQPYEAVRTVYDAIAQDLVPQACGRFDKPTQQEFADNLGYPDCRAAVHALNGEVTDMNAYAESIPSSLAEPVRGERVTVSSCEFGVRGGPPLGTFTVTKVELGQWLITDHQREPGPCPSPTP